MKIKLKYFLVTLFFLLAVNFLLVQNIRVVQGKAKRFETSLNALNGQVEKFRTSDSLNAARAQSLTLKARELEKMNDNLARAVDDLGIKLKRATSITQTSLQSHYQIQTLLRDSIQILQQQLSNGTNSIDTIYFQYSRYSDPWITFYQRQYNGQVETSIKTRDSIIVVQHWQPYKFWFIRWGKKEHWHTVKSYNPYSEIQLTMNVVLEK